MCCNINEFLARADVCSPEALTEIWQPPCLRLLILLGKRILESPSGKAGPKEGNFLEHSLFLPYNVRVCSVSSCHPPSLTCHRGPEGCSCQCLWQTILNTENGINGSPAWTLLVLASILMSPLTRDTRSLSAKLCFSEGQLQTPSIIHGGKSSKVNPRS